MEEILLVDGYNIIGAIGEQEGSLPEDLEDRRDWLIEKLAEYQGYTGIKVYVVFDAHSVTGIGKVYKQHQIEVIYTKEKETADERIERLAKELKRVKRRIYVATSDHTEQWVVFGQGALRKSARELLLELQNLESSISTELEQSFKPKKAHKFSLKPEVAELFEKWRRGK